MGESVNMDHEFSIQTSLEAGTQHASFADKFNECLEKWSQINQSFQADVMELIMERQNTMSPVFNENKGCVERKDTDIESQHMEHLTEPDFRPSAVRSAVTNKGLMYDDDDDDCCNNNFCLLFALTCGINTG